MLPLNIVLWLLDLHKITLFIRFSCVESFWKMFQRTLRNFLLFANVRKWSAFGTTLTFWYLISYKNYKIKKMYSHCTDVFKQSQSCVSLSNSLSCIIPHPISSGHTNNASSTRSFCWELWNNWMKWQRKWGVCLACWPMFSLSLDQSEQVPRTQRHNMNFHMIFVLSHVHAWSVFAAFHLPFFIIHSCHLWSGPINLIEAGHSCFHLWQSYFRTPSSVHSNSMHGILLFRFGRMSWQRVCVCVAASYDDDRVDVLPVFMAILWYRAIQCDRHRIILVIESAGWLWDALFIIPAFVRFIHGWSAHSPPLTRSHTFNIPNAP